MRSRIYRGKCLFDEKRGLMLITEVYIEKLRSFWHFILVSPPDSIHKNADLIVLKQALFKLNRNQIKLIKTSAVRLCTLRPSPAPVWVKWTFNSVGWMWNYLDQNTWWCRYRSMKHSVVLWVRPGVLTWWSVITKLSFIHSLTRDQFTERADVRARYRARVTRWKIDDEERRKRGLLTDVVMKS